MEISIFLAVCKTDIGTAMSFIDNFFCDGNALSIMFGMLVFCLKISCDGLNLLLLIKAHESAML